jgi:hypothetical protein
MGCHSRSARSKPDYSAIAEFNDLLANRGKLTFLSWGGQWVGTDCDTDLTFMPGGVVEMTGYGYTVNTFAGTYQIDAERVVSLQLPTLPNGWPPMVLEKDSASLLLRSKDPAQGSAAGSRRGAALRGGEKSYWPFRLVSRRPVDAATTGPST